MVHLLFSESSTIGIRRNLSPRYYLPRTTIQVETPYGVVNTKRTQLGDQIRYKPEFEDCRQRAQEANLSTQTVRKTVEYLIAKKAHTDVIGPPEEN